MRIAFLLAKYGRGGVERMLINTASGLAQRGHTVDYLAPDDGVYLDGLDAQVVRHFLPLKHATQCRYLRHYLQRQIPDALIVAKDRDLATALQLLRAYHSPTRLIMRPGTVVSAKFRPYQHLQRELSFWQMRRRYRQTTALVANAESVREDIARIVGIPAQQIFLIRNPVITPNLLQQANAPALHPWLEQTVPLILGMGNLHRVKDFITLIRAFAQVRRERPARLLILGEGHLRTSLEREIQRLGLSADVDLPGFVENPYPFLKAARVFVLSSLREGSPNALTEALALGTPVVATDCPGGVREILQHGQYGTVVPMRAPEIMAAAILQTLDHPLASPLLQTAVADYTIERTALAYEAMLLSLPFPPPLR
ncbi:glycosyltransferase [Thiorhodospira sibirica]|uniref:glycosyltransferase n=1 Tax=Thiorhodospira sibirica TaxID=154347 RepID=UPI00022C179D|nr:glycosyltransferase [Thiorhodospira sibirica]